MVQLLVYLVVILIVIGLLVWAVTLLGGVGIPQPVIVALQILVILIGVILLLNVAGLIPAWR